MRIPDEQMQLFEQRLWEYAEEHDLLRAHEGAPR